MATTRDRKDARSGQARSSRRRLPFVPPGRFAALGALPGRCAEWLSDCLHLDLDRGRGVLWLPVAVAVGVAVYFALPREPHWPTMLALAGALVAGAMASRRRPPVFAALAMAASVAFGVAAAAGQTARVAAPVLGWEGTHTLTGFVERREPRPDGAVRYVVRVESLSRLDPAETPARVRFTSRGREDPLDVGEGLTALVRLAPPRGPVAPGAYDGARSLFFQRIGGTGFSYGQPRPADLGPPPLLLRAKAAVAGVRERIAGRLRAALPGENGELAATLLVGDRGGIPESTQEALRASGLGHILAISGLHMALVAGTVFAVLRLSLAAIPPVALRYPIKKWAAAAALAAGLFYLIVSGGAVATIRAFVMLAVALVAVLADRPALTLRSVAVAALAIMLFDPAAVVSPGFQMSFAAVIALVAGYEYLASRERADRPPPRRGPVLRVLRLAALWIAGLALTSLIAGLATGPIGAFHFQRIAVFGLLGNLLAMPLVTLIVMPMGVLSVAVMPLGVDPVPLAAMGWGLDGVVAVAKRVASLGGDAGHVGRMPAAAVLLMAAGLLWLALWTARWRVLGLPLVLAGLALTPAAARPDILVSDDGRTVAARGTDGRLTIATARGGDFAAAMWLRADGDPRPLEDVTVRAGVSCDPFGCTLPIARGPGDIGGRRIAFVEQSQAFLLDCRRAEILVTRHTRPAGCEGPRLVIDRHMLMEQGALALFRIKDPPGYRIERARPPVPRPWSARPVIRR
ncbi:ComEC/Rec2 family competence protein [Amorphus orientalis]|uniref:Competence protein ComEC n=1 Tax=Amorphus orientalis TaxID=649198 RepID=A0AAE3VPC3_9HYPH|nr:ComEC/Rec2 family competence protein [Amorphus orientalis]MDQ0315558.1 competence protein ComEC [Amorphus orientalis]